MPLHELHSENDCIVLLFKTIFRHCIFFLSSVFTDGKEGHAMKLEKFWLTFSSFNAMLTKIEKILWLVLPGKICLMSSISLREHFVYCKGTE